MGRGVGVGLQHSPRGGSSEGGGAGGDAEGDAGGRLVGRESELAALETALTSLLEQRRGGVILLTGEAGSGEGRADRTHLLTPHATPSYVNPIPQAACATR